MFISEYKSAMKHIKKKENSSLVFQYFRINKILSVGKIHYGLNIGNMFLQHITFTFN